ncbi:lysophosphatidic acid receptor 6 [Chiloscyllium punctatum]
MGEVNGSCLNPKQWTDHLYVTLFSFIFLLGLLFNTLALVFFFRFTKIRSQTTVYMKNLACTDLLLVASLPVRILYYVDRRTLPPLLCELTGLIFLVNMYGSIFFLTCISLDRCVAICFPMKSRVNSLRGQAKWISAGVWLLVVGASIPPYLLIRKPGNATEECQLCFHQKPSYVTNPATVVPTLLVGYGIPLSTILVCSLALLRGVHRSSAARMDYVDWHKIRNMVAANVVIFVICFLPYHTVLLLYLAAPSQERALGASYRATISVACLNAIFDPLAYYFATETFQKSVGMKALRNALTSNTDSVDCNNRSRSPPRAKPDAGTRKGRT